jgi:AcrR family transcriptional regulator
MPGETRQKILDATERLIQMRGLGRVTTKEIARETGLSEGALYRHFGHKEEVFFEIVQKYLPIFLDTLNAHMAGTGNVIENLEAIALAAIEYYGKLIPMGASFLADADLLAEYRKQLQQISGGPQRFFEVVAAYIEEEQQLGRIAQLTPALSIAIQLLGPCFHYEFMRQFTGEQPFGWSDHEFVKALIQGLIPVLFPAP